jgi:hypothetical protein
MTNLSEQDAAKAIQAAWDLDRALLPAVAFYDDGTNLTNLQAWKDADVAELLRRVRGTIDRALKRLEQ